MNTTSLLALLPTLKTADPKLKVGELYLFHLTNRQCPIEDSLIGVYNGYDTKGIRLESMTFDMIHYLHGELLPSTYCYCRPATMGEVRDYFYNLALAEISEHGMPRPMEFHRPFTDEE